MLRLRLLFPVVIVAATILVALPVSPALADFYTVNVTTDGNDTNTADGICDSDPVVGTQCSLRAAIQQANVTGAGDFINFDDVVFPTATPAVIDLGSNLPTLIGDNDKIDATFAGVIIDSDAATDTRAFNCLTLSGNGNTAAGLQITDCTAGITVSGVAGVVGPGNTIYDNQTGVSVFGTGTGNSRIVANRIGTDVSGQLAHPEGGNTTGISISNAGNTVGGTTVGDRNIISNNTTGIVISQLAATNNAVRGNYVGPNILGTGDLGNSAGIFIHSGAALNTIGGTGPGEGNVISGNTLRNLQLRNNGSGNVIAGNIIGPDKNGSGAVMTNGQGITIEVGATGYTIGPGNVISDNSFGISMDGAGSGAQQNVVKGNLIGTNLSGASAVPNGTAVLIFQGASLNTIGGTAPGDGNVIAFNNGTGVSVDGADTTGNSIRANSIRANVGPEIDNLNGGNTELAPPVLTAASASATSVSGTACPNCPVDIFSTGVAGSDPRIYEGSITANGNGTFTFTKASALAGPSLVATQTDSFGNTSEVSVAVAAEICDGLDNDADSFVDEGHPNADGDNRKDCVDFGQTAFYPPGHAHAAPTVDCSGLSEDFDGFKDSDGCPEPDNDNDLKSDADDACDGTGENAGPDGALGVGGDQNHNGLVDGGETWATPGTSGNDDLQKTYEDYDGIIDTDGCHDSPCDDADGDSFGAMIGPCKLFADEREAQLGTNPVRACAATPTANDEATDPYPLDTNDDGFTDISDIVAVGGVFGRAQTPSNVRYDLNLDGFIDITDIVLMGNRFGKACVAPGPMG